MAMLQRIVLWLRGWRYDLDGWIVRARRADDPHPDQLSPVYGFVEEASIAARTLDAAWAIDGGLLSIREPAP